jgi:hypothetical protein
MCCANQDQTFVELECSLTSDMARMSQYCHRWRLKPSATKTVSSVFHLHNATANRELKIELDGQPLKHDPHPVYLGVTLDRTLSYKEHLKKTAGKLKTRNNLFSKLAGTSWGADAATMRTSAIALCYSVAEYCAPVWAKSTHTSLVDMQLNTTMRHITGTLRSTPTPWLPVLSTIEPPELRRKIATDRLIDKAINHPEWILHQDILHPPQYRLKSRDPIWKDLTPIDATARWRESWRSANVVNNFLVDDPAIRQPGFLLPRHQWSLLNRFRTEQGLCKSCLRRWGLADSDLCDCGEPQSMSHIVNSCPLTRFQGGIVELHKADKTASDWLTSYGT